MNLYGCNTAYKMDFAIIVLSPFIKHTIYTWLNNNCTKEDRNKVIFVTSYLVFTFLCEYAEAFGTTEHLILIGVISLSWKWHFHAALSYVEVIL